MRENELVNEPNKGLLSVLTQAVKYEFRLAVGAVLGDVKSTELKSDDLNRKNLVRRRGEDLVLGGHMRLVDRGRDAGEPLHRLRLRKSCFGVRRDDRMTDLLLM